MAKRKKRSAIRRTKSKAAKQYRKAAKRSVKRRVAKNLGRTTKKVASRRTAQKRTRVARSKQAPTPVVEDTVINVVDEPIPGVVRVTEIEEVNVAVPDSEEENGD